MQSCVSTALCVGRPTVARAIECQGDAVGLDLQHIDQDKGRSPRGKGAGIATHRVEPTIWPLRAVYIGPVEENAPSRSAAALTAVVAAATLAAFLVARNVGDGHGARNPIKLAEVDLGLASAVGSGLEGLADDDSVCGARFRPGDLWVSKQVRRRAAGKR